MAYNLAASSTLYIGAFGVLAVAGVAMLTFRFELAVRRFEVVRSQVWNRRVRLDETKSANLADNRWLTSVVSSFEAD